MNIDALSLYNELFAVYGETQWWPGESDDEVIVGAILTQNTSWSNVEKSLSILKKNGLMKIEKLAVVDQGKLMELIRPSGFYTQKSRTIIDLSSMIVKNFGGVDQMKNESLERLEELLRPIKGIGQETMDGILCYAMEKSVFVVDKYTIRLLERLGVRNMKDAPGIKRYVQASVGRDLGKLKNFHGLIVSFSKEHCKAKPQCNGCPLRKKCDFGSNR